MFNTTDMTTLPHRLRALKAILGTDSPEVRGWAPAVQQEAQKVVNAMIAEIERLRAEMAGLREQVQHLQSLLVDADNICKEHGGCDLQDCIDNDGDLYQSQAMADALDAARKGGGMKEHPILFSAPMVRALLAGTKTQTRRVAKPQPDYICQDGTPARSTDTAKVRRGQMMTFSCPYGQPGDRLWVREAWSAHKDEDHLPPRDCSRDIRFYEVEHGRQRGLNPRIGKLRPSMFMPRWHSRITLEVTGVRVERLQDISEADAIAEGCITAGSIQVLSERRNHLSSPDVAGIDGKVYQDAAHAYSALWESINGPGSWDANPWVWVVEFKRVTP